MAQSGKGVALRTAIQNQIPFLVDSASQTPFDYAYNKNIYDGIANIFKHLEVPGTYLDYTAFEYAVKTRGASQKRMLENTLFTETKVMSNVKLPIIGQLKGGFKNMKGDEMNQVMFMDVHNALHQELVKKYVDLHAESLKIIEYQCSRIQLNLKTGSDESLNFLKLIEIADDEALHDSSIEWFIEYKWQNQKTKIVIQSMIYIIYFIIHSLYVVEYYDSIKFLWVLFGFNTFILGYEIYQMKCEGLTTYFEGGWNYIDLIGSIFMISFCLLKPFVFNKEIKSSKNVTILRSIQTLLLFWGTLTMSIRAINQLRIFNHTRSLINMLVQSVQDMVPFFILFLTTIFIFSLMLQVIEKQQLEHNLHVKFSDTLLVIYQLCFGENFGMEDFNQTTAKLILFVMSTVFLNIVILNLLIAIINNTYERLLSQSKSSNIKQKARMLYESEAFMLYKSNKGQAMYLHVLQYDRNDEEGNQVDEWEGRLRQITNSTDKIASKVEEQNLKVEYIQEIFPDHIDQVDKVEQKVERVERRIDEVESKIIDHIKNFEMTLLQIHRRVKQGANYSQQIQEEQD